ncbi:hypothetical protein ABIB25_002414 [Nakamurella sp. UYEF19]
MAGVITTQLLVLTVPSSSLPPENTANNELSGWMYFRSKPPVVVVPVVDEDEAHPLKVGRCGAEVGGETTMIDPVPPLASGLPDEGSGPFRCANVPSLASSCLWR